MFDEYAHSDVSPISNLPKVLVVDDIKENHRAFNQILGDLDAELFNANSGEEALALTLRHQFAVILLDVMMPGMDGYETANLIRINEDTKFTPIIFVTAMEPNEDNEQIGYGIGAVDYLFKPIKPAILTGKVTVFIELERQRHKIKQTLQDIQRLEKRNDLLLKSVGEGILGLDQTGTVTFSNPAARKMLGFEEHELEHINFMDISSQASTENYHTNWVDSDVYQCCIRGLGHHENIGLFWSKDRSPFPVEYLATPIREMHEEAFVGVVIAFQDVTERRKTEDQLARLAQVDTLTGLYNRYAFSKQLTQSLSRAERHKNELALLFIDLDNFKQVNDNLGHEIGDRLLRECANRLLNCVRDGDILSRIGGDEFTAIIESVNSGRGAAIVAKKIIHELSRPFEVNGNEILVGASIGISTFPESGSDAESLLRSADISMYKAKQSGRNTYQFFTDAMQKEVAEELTLEKSLRSAVQNEQFTVHYQPKVNPKNGQVLGAEALVRWKGENDRFISPEIFIPKAEDIGLICQIGEWVLSQSCHQMKQWLNEGVFSHSESIAVNLSMRQLMNPELIRVIEQCLNSSQLEARHLELEITESMMMQSPDSIIELLNNIHELGVRISLDDFGTGYSSLSYLRELPIDCLKVDQSFVQALGRPNGNAIVKAIVNLGKNLDLNVVAEGVETSDQLDFLKLQGVDLIQGYFYSKPVTGDMFKKFVNECAHAAT